MRGEGGREGSYKLRDKKNDKRRFNVFKTVEVLFMKVSFASKIRSFPALTFNLRIFWFFISCKKVSVLNTISDLNRTKSTKIEIQNFMFSLRYYTKPKRNFFLGHPVVFGRSSLQTDKFWTRLSSFN